MVQLADTDIRTREVLGYRGLHLFHFSRSSCSQKTRIVLALKGVEWQSHVVDLSAHENHGAWYLGINPRGLVPTLVHDGAVHVESNDIIRYLESRFPDPPLIPTGAEAEMARALEREDALHLALRTLSFRFVLGRRGSPKPAEVLQRFRADRLDPGAALAIDPRKQIELDFYHRLGSEGITRDAVRDAAGRFRAAFDELEERLADGPYLLGSSLSVLDVAWYVYANRLLAGGYPIGRLHPRVHDWYRALDQRPEFSREVEMPPELAGHVAATRRAQEAAGDTLVEVAGLIEI